MGDWSRGLITDRESLIRLVRRGEWNHLYFSHVLREKRGLRLVQDGTVHVLRDGKGQCRAGLYISHGGALHCCFEPSELRGEDLRGLERLLTGRAFFSFIGRKDRIDLIEELCNPGESHMVDYDLMVREAKAPPADDLGGDVVIRPAGREDFPLLYPLEEAYQKEEVLRDPDSLNVPYLKKRFLLQLETSFIWAAFYRGKPVAKGGTNGVGFDYCQIGGVYTLPGERHRGWGTLVMNRINRDLAEKGWGTSLFVRKTNAHARSLYEGCGYRHEGDFRIVYPGE